MCLMCFLTMCYLQEPAFNMQAPKKKARKVKNKTGEDDVQAGLKTPEAQLNENAEPLTKEWTAPLYTTGDKIWMQKYLDPGPQVIVNEQLPSYETMEDLFNGPSSMETQPDNSPLFISEEAIAVLPDGRNVEWWPYEEIDQSNMQDLSLQEYLMDASKPVHTNFILPKQELALCYTCPVYFGCTENKKIVLNALCNSIHPKLQQEWGSFSCHCKLIPRLQLSQTARNMKKVFLRCPKGKEDSCKYFQWIHQVPKPLRIPKACSKSVLKKRMHDMVQERLQLQNQPKMDLKQRMQEQQEGPQQKRAKVEEGGFKFP